MFILEKCIKDTLLHGLSRFSVQKLYMYDNTETGSVFKGRRQAAGKVKVRSPGALSYLVLEAVRILQAQEFHIPEQK